MEEPIGKSREHEDFRIPRVNELALAIVQPPLASSDFQVIPLMLQLLQVKGQFGGKDHEDPLQHLKNFISVCSLHEQSHDAIRLCLFPFSLTEDAQVWLNSLWPNSINTWEQLATKFLKRYFPPTKTMKLRDDIMHFRQDEEEPLFEAWERFKGMLMRCPHHGLSDEVIMEQFYVRLNEMTRSWVDSSSDGAFLKKTYDDAVVLLDTMAENDYSWARRDRDANLITSASAFKEPAHLQEDRMNRVISKLSTLSTIEKSVDEINMTEDIRSMLITQLSEMKNITAELSMREDMKSMLITKLSIVMKHVNEASIDEPDLPQVISAESGHHQNYCTSNVEETKYINNFNHFQGEKQWSEPQRDNLQWQPIQTWNGNVGGNELLQNKQGGNQWDSGPGDPSQSLSYKKPQGFSSPQHFQPYYNENQQRYPSQHWGHPEDSY